MRLHLTCLPFVILAITAQTVFAAVDLVTIPRREGTQLTIYNSEDITMVREHRLLTVKPGIITIIRRLKDQRINNVVARQYKRRLDNHYVLYYDLIDYDETFVYEEEIVSGKPVAAKVELERRFDDNVVLWGSEGKPKDWDSNEPGAYVDLHEIDGRVERVDQNHVKYFLDLNPGEKRFVRCSVTYKRRKVGPELNAEKRREPL
jgi:hypothetical protein